MDGSLGQRVRFFLVDGPTETLPELGQGPPEAHRTGDLKPEQLFVADLAHPAERPAGGNGRRQLAQFQTQPKRVASSGRNRPSRQLADAVGEPGKEAGRQDPGQSHQA